MNSLITTNYEGHFFIIEERDTILWFGFIYQEKEDKVYYVIYNPDEDNFNNNCFSDTKDIFLNGYPEKGKLTFFSNAGHLVTYIAEHNNRQPLKNQFPLDEFESYESIVEEGKHLYEDMDDISIFASDINSWVNKVMPSN